MHVHTRQTEKGITLLEMVVTISILSILSILIISAFPSVRSEQQIKTFQQELQESLHTAQQMAFNETRQDDCLVLYGGDRDEGRNCSDVGVALEASEIITFADTSNPDSNLYNAGDYVLSRRSFSSALVAPSTSFVFEAAPPTITMYTNGAIQSLIEPAKLRLEAGDAQVELEVYSYGRVERTGTLSENP